MQLIGVILAMGASALLLMYHSAAQLEQAKHLKHLEMRAHEAAVVAYIRQVVNCSAIQLNGADVILWGHVGGRLTRMYGQLEVTASKRIEGIQLRAKWHQIDPHTKQYRTKDYVLPLCPLTRNCHLNRLGDSDLYREVCRVPN